MIIRFRDQIETIDDATAAEVARLLESSGSPGSVARQLGLAGSGVVAALARWGLGPEGSEGLPLVRQGSTGRPGLVAAVSEDQLATLGVDSGSPSARPARLALASGLLQVLDAWEPSHHAAQQADDLGERSTSAYWHMIAHRREPDPGNALYWARRVGRPPILPTIADAARPLLEAHGDPTLTARLLEAGAWNPAAMIDLATRARPGTPLDHLARRLQRLEMVELLGLSLLELNS